MISLQISSANQTKAACKAWYAAFLIIWIDLFVEDNILKLNRTFATRVISCATLKSF
jgi:hypothetical protein